jgi:hypothetical protein
VAVETNRIGHAGVRLLSQITDMNQNTIQRGQWKLEQGLSTCPTHQVRLVGAERPPVEKRLGDRDGFVADY